MCLQCNQLVGKGWALFNHMKQCRGLPDTTYLAPVEAQEHCLMDEHNDDQQMILEDLVDNQRPAMGTTRVHFAPKTLEILEFLGTSEKGEGCSREHAQGWLDYIKKKGGVVQLCCLRTFERAGTTLPRSSYTFLALRLPRNALPLHALPLQALSLRAFRSLP